LNTDYIFIGGSTVKNGLTDAFIKNLKLHTLLPIVLFPGDFSQLTKRADALLFLSLLSGRNPEYLIEQQIKSVPFLKNTDLEIIPTGYILLDGGTQSSVLKISKTKPIPQENTELAVDTALAGMYKGKKLIYLEAGSGATKPVNGEIISKVKTHISVPVIVGGGICSRKQLHYAYDHGADLVVIGTAFENNTLNLL
jgi:putative glycerol-1-phosphate prenyltransferase